MDVHPTKNCINRYWSIPISLYRKTIHKIDTIQLIFHAKFRARCVEAPLREKPRVEAPTFKFARAMVNSIATDWVTRYDPTYAWLWMSLSMFNHLLDFCDPTRQVWSGTCMMSSACFHHGFSCFSRCPSPLGTFPSTSFRIFAIKLHFSIISIYTKIFTIKVK